MGATIKEAAGLIAKGEAVISAAAAYDAVPVTAFTDAYKAIKAGQVTLSALAKEAKVSASTVGYHALAWQVLAEYKADGTPASHVLLTCVKAHKQEGYGKGAAQTALAMSTATTVRTALATIAGGIKEAADKAAGKAPRTVTPRTGGQYCDSAVKALTEAIGKATDGSITAKHVADLTNLVAALAGKFTPATTPQTVTV